MFKAGYDHKMLIALHKELTTWKTGQLRLHCLSQYDEQVQSVLKAQRRLGWKQFLEGLLVQEWHTYTTQILDPTEHPVYASTISKAIKAGWQLIHNTWTARNTQLHLTDRIHEVEGRTELLQAIEVEWNIGLSCLPHNDFGYLFTMSKQTLATKSLTCQKDWLAMIKKGRELHRDHNRVQDAFTHPGALRTWIGLDKEN